MKPLLKPSRSRRSRRVIWYREGSQTEGGRIKAWCKLEHELGLGSGFTENYSARSPRVARYDAVTSFGLPSRNQMTRLDLRERIAF